MTPGHDRRFRCAIALIVFTYEDGDGNTRCVVCHRTLKPLKGTP